MAKFTDEHKAERAMSYFEEGVHKVQIEDVTFGVTPKDQEYAEFAIIDPEEPERKAQVRIWFTTDAAIGYSFNVFKQIFVHNTPEKNRDKMRETMDALTDTEGLAKIAENLRGKEAWYSTYRNLERPYTKQDGTTAYSYDRNIYGYEPKAKPVTDASKAMDAMGGGDTITPINSDDEPFPFKG